MVYRQAARAPTQSTPRCRSIPQPFAQNLDRVANLHAVGAAGETVSALGASRRRDVSLIAEECAASADVSLMAFQ